MEKKLKVNNENVRELIERAKETIITEKCSLADACEKNGFFISSMEHYISNCKEIDNVVELWNEVKIIHKDIILSRFCIERLNGNMHYASGLGMKDIEKVYTSFIVPGLKLSGKELQEYKEKRSFIDFDAFVEFWDKYQSGEIYKSSILQRLNEIKTHFNKAKFGNIKHQVSQYEFLKNDEEINALINEIEKPMLEKRIQREAEWQRKRDEKIREKLTYHIDGYLNGSDGPFEIEIQDLILEIDKMDDKAIEERYPWMTINDLRKVAKMIAYSRTPKGIREKIDETKRKEEEKQRIINRTEDIIRGNFIKHGILTNLDFYKYFSNAPYIMFYTKKRAEYSWDKFKELMTKSTEELEKRRIDIEFWLDYYDTYLFLLSKYIMVDFNKLLKKTPDELIDIELIAQNGHKAFNRKNYRVNNPLGDIIIDDEDKDTFEKMSMDVRIRRVNNDKVQLENELTMIKSIIEKRAKK